MVLDCEFRMRIVVVWSAVLSIFLVCLAGCNGVKLVGNTIETYGDMRVVVSDQFKHVGVVTCNDFPESEACSVRSLDYRADIYAKENDGDLQAMLVVISKATTSTRTFYYDTGRYFDYAGVRFSEYYHDFVLNDSKIDPEVAVHMRVLSRHGIGTQATSLLAVAMSRRVDSHHRVIIGYAVPGGAKSVDGETAWKEVVREGLFSSVDVKQAAK